MIDDMDAESDVDAEPVEDLDDRRADELPEVTDAVELLFPLADELVVADAVDEEPIFVHPAGISSLRLTTLAFLLKKAGYSTSTPRITGPLTLRFADLLNTFLILGA